MENKKLSYAELEQYAQELEQKNVLLKESETRFCLALKNSNVTLSAQNRDLELIWMYNQKTVDPRKSIGLTDFDIFPPETANFLVSLKQQVLESGKEICKEQWLENNGRKYFVELFIQPITDSAGSISGITMTTIDLTKTKLAEDALLESNDRLKLALKAGKAGSWFWDPVNDTFDYSDELKTIFGIDQDLPFETWEKSMHPDDLETAKKRVLECIETKTDLAHDYRIILPDNKIRWIRELGKPYYHGGTLVRMIGLCIDITERKNEQELIKAKECAEAGEARFKNMFDGHDAIMMIVEPESGLIIDANPAAIDFYGFSKKTLLSMRFHEINILPYEQLKIELLKAVKQEQNYFVFPHKLANGDFRTVEIHSSPIDYGGKEMLFSIIRDITDRKKTEEALKDQNVKFDIASEGAKMAWWEMDLKTGKMTFNKLKAEMLGFPPEKFKHYIDYTNLVHPDDLDLIMDNMRNHIDGKAEKYEVEYRILTNTGDYKWFYDIGTVFKRDEKGKPLTVFGSVLDITQRKETEIALREAKEKVEESEKKYKLIAENTSDGIMVIGADTHIKYVSPAYINQIGYSEDETLSRDAESIYNMIHPDDRENLFATIFNAISEKKVELVYTYRVKQKAGHYLWREDHAKFNFDGSGNHLDMYVISRDITERKKVELELNNYREHLEELVKNRTLELETANATKDKFFSIIAHDLKNPFAGIIGTAELLMLGLDKVKDEKTLNRVKRIFAAGHSAHKLLENLLVWAGSQTGSIAFNPENINPTNLINDVFNFSESACEAKNISFDYEIEQGSQVYADKNMLNTILRNLVGNAIKYTHQAGHIKISVLKHINSIEFSVTDSGVGMSKERIDKIFSIGEKSSSPGTENERGTGLGLILCKEFVGKHGGEIWAESEVGIGSVFKFTIPLIN